MKTHYPCNHDLILTVYKIYTLHCDFGLKYKKKKSIGELGMDLQEPDSNIFNGFNKDMIMSCKSYGGYLKASSLKPKEIANKGLSAVFLGFLPDSRRRLSMADTYTFLGHFEPGSIPPGGSHQRQTQVASCLKPS